MVEFDYNNAKNTKICHTFFELNCDYHPQTSDKKDLDLYSLSKSANKLVTKLRKQMIVGKKNLQHTQELQK